MKAAVAFILLVRIAGAPGEVPVSGRVGLPYPSMDVCLDMAQRTLATIAPEGTPVLELSCNAMVIGPVVAQPKAGQ